MTEIASEIQSMEHGERSRMLREMAADVAAVNKANGWFDTSRGFAEDIALLHSEISEMLEAYRVGGLEDQTADGGKPEGVGSEAADLLIRLLDTVYRYNIDLSFEFHRKLKHNLTRGYRHGGKRL